MRKFVESHTNLTDGVINNSFIIEWFEKLGLIAEKTKIYGVTENSELGELFGTFLPRNYEGYVKLQENKEDIQNKTHLYLHELSHGACCETFPFGKKIARLDKIIHEQEKELFGDLEPPFYVQTSIEDEIADMERPVIKVNKSSFEKYMKNKEELTDIYLASWKLVEGFALVLHEELFQEKNIELSPNYQVAYKYVRDIPLVGEKSLTNLVDALKSPLYENGLKYTYAKIVN